MKAVAVLVAAGSGERFGNSAKVLAPLLHRPVLAWTLDAFQQTPDITGIVIVVGPHTEPDVRELVSSGGWPKVIAIVQGGNTRQDSMANGVAAVPLDTDVVLVHDAARPLVTPQQITRCIEVAQEHGGAIFAAPVTDTIKKVHDGEIVETIDRSTLWGAQTPQAFRFDEMNAIVEYSQLTTLPMTDEASLAEVLEIPVQIVPGDSINLKITWPTDLIVAEALLRARKEST